MKYGEKLAEFRKSKSLSQEDLARIAGIDRSYISKIELGKTSISIIQMDKLAKALDLSIRDFFE